MPGVEDWINCPLGIIQSIYDKKGKVDSSDVQEYFNSKLQAKECLAWIPSLNDTPLHSLKPNSLVRYRCMVQDMFDPEFYLGHYEVREKCTEKKAMKSGKYKDIAECGPNQEILMDSQNNVTLDRQTLYCIPIPGETSWVKEAFADKCGTKVYPSTANIPVRSKRSLDEEETSKELQEGVCQMDCSSDNIVETNSGTKKNRTSNNDEAQGAPVLPDLNFPLKGEKGIPCLVKLYDDIDTFCVNDLVEFIGVLSVDPSLAQNQSEESTGLQSSVEDYEMSIEERQAHAPPPSLVPRLHAVLAKKLIHNNPYLDVVSKTDTEFNTVLSELQRDIVRLRQQIISTLEHVTFGDNLAAEYLLCHLISSIYGRADILPLGKFCLNITGCPPSQEFSQLLFNFISVIATKCHHLPISIDNMNKLRLCPQKDYTANRLLSGILQLGQDTNLLLDETALQPGQLEVTGVKNVTALGHMISWQKVSYDFCYHQQEFPTNIQTLIISEGKSILPSDCMLPLSTSIPTGKCLQDHFAKLDEILNEELLRKIRVFISVAKLLNYSITDEVQKFIQEDFVEIRKDDPKNMSAEDFHSLLNLVRLISLSHLKVSPTKALWDKVKTMESQRKIRLQTSGSK